MPQDPDENHYDVYIAGALTSLGPDHALRKRMYEDVAQVCRQLGLNPYVPHLRTDPVDHPQVSPRDVYTIDTDRVKRAKLIIAFADVASFGVGTELEVAQAHGKDAILMIRVGTPVSRMVVGNPCVRGQVAFSKATWQKSLHLLRLEILHLAGLMSSYRAVSSAAEEGMAEPETFYLEIHLPTKYNDGQPVPEEEFTEFEQFLGRRFGGSFHDLRSGDWHDDTGRVYTDENRVYKTFVAETLGGAELKLLRHTLEERFKQHKIWMVQVPAKRV